MERKSFDLDRKKRVERRAHDLENENKLGSKVVHSFIIINLLCSKFVRMKDMLCIEDNVAAPPFLTSFRIDMNDFVNLREVIAKRSAFSAFSRA